jgi:cobalt-zinc-cadmium efflux system outer membrane protein
MRFLLLFAALALGPPANAQTLRDAVEAAWARQPAARAQSARESELAARRDAANALTPEPPSVGIGYRSDQPFQNEGQRELEAEIALPIWLPGQSARQTAVVDAERGQLEGTLAAAKWKIAGEVREAYWEARIAEVERALASRKVEEAAALAADVARRVKAGDLARVDLNQAQGAEQSARAAAADAELKAFRARQAFETLTGMTTVPAVEETAGVAPALDDHPQLASRQRAAATARVKLVQAAEDRRDNPEFALGMRRERGAIDQPYDNSLILKFKLPFAIDARNRPRIAAANAELIEVQAEYGLERARVAAEIGAARRGFELAETIRTLATTRFALAADTQRLIARAFTLGEIDLVSRLRAENDRFDAELGLNRAEAELARAVSRLNQATGVLP